jgi:hypothetical protein
LVERVTAKVNKIKIIAEKTKAKIIYNLSPHKEHPPKISFIKPCF